MPIYEIEGVQVVVNRHFLNEGPTICERLVDILYELYLDAKENPKEQLTESR